MALLTAESVSILHLEEVPVAFNPNLSVSKIGERLYILSFMMGPPSPISKDIASLTSHLSTLIEARSVSQNDLDLDPLVSFALQESQEDGRSQETRRAQWEFVLKDEVFKLAVSIVGWLPIKILN